MRILSFDPEVESDIRNAQSYFEEKRPGLGVDFKERVFKQFRRIAQFPLAAPIVEEDVRKIGIEKFHFEIYYRVGETEIFIIEVRHKRRHPDTWKKRVKPKQL